MSYSVFSCTAPEALDRFRINNNANVTITPRSPYGFYLASIAVGLKASFSHALCVKGELQYVQISVFSTAVCLALMYVCCHAVSACASALLVASGCVLGTGYQHVQENPEAWEKSKLGLSRSAGERSHTVVDKDYTPRPRRNTKPPTAPAVFVVNSAV